jgi:hypothetical protein
MLLHYILLLNSHKKNIDVHVYVRNSYFFLEIRYLSFYFNHSWFENNKSIMMCKGGMAILNYGCVPSITNQS